MKSSTKVRVASLALVLGAAGAAMPTWVDVIGDARAIVGRPLTPVSYAGVARRSAYRGAAVTTAAVATTAVVATNAYAASSAEAAAAQSAQAAAAQSASTPPPAPPAGSLPVGTVVTQLPGGCVSAPVSGVEYSLCDGVYYRPAFQGNNLVYVVQVP